MKLTITTESGLLLVKFGPENDKFSIDEASEHLRRAIATAKSKGIRKIVLNMKGHFVTYEDVGLILSYAKDTELTLVFCGLNAAAESKLRTLGLEFILKGPTFSDVEAAIAALAA